MKNKKKEKESVYPQMAQMDIQCKYSEGKNIWLIIHIYHTKLWGHHQNSVAI